MGVDSGAELQRKVYLTRNLDRAVPPNSSALAIELQAPKLSVRLPRKPAGFSQSQAVMVD